LKWYFSFALIVLHNRHKTNMYHYFTCNYDINTHKYYIQWWLQTILCTQYRHFFRRLYQQKCVPCVFVSSLNKTRTLPNTVISTIYYFLIGHVQYSSWNKTLLRLTITTTNIHIYIIFIVRFNLKTNGKVKKIGNIKL